MENDISELKNYSLVVDETGYGKVYYRTPCGFSAVIAEYYVDLTKKAPTLINFLDPLTTVDIAYKVSKLIKESEKCN